MLKQLIVPMSSQKYAVLCPLTRLLLFILMCDVAISQVGTDVFLYSHLYHHVSSSSVFKKWHLCMSPKKNVTCGDHGRPSFSCICSTEIRYFSHFQPCSWRQNCAFKAITRSFSKTRFSCLNLTGAQAQSFVSPHLGMARHTPNENRYCRE